MNGTYLNGPESIACPGLVKKPNKFSTIPFVETASIPDKMWC